MEHATLEEMRSALAAECGGELEGVLLKNGPSQFHSPDVLEMLLWNVVIAFVVSFASNVAAMALPRKTTLTFGDLQAIRKAAGTRVEIASTPTVEAVSQAIQLALPTTMAASERGALSDKLAAAILDKLHNV